MTRLQRAVQTATTLGYIAGKYGGGVVRKSDTRALITGIRDEEKAVAAVFEAHGFVPGAQVTRQQVKIDDSWIIDITYSL